MSIPSYQEFMLPLLKLASNKNEISLQSAYIQLADLFKLSNEDKNKLLPSGRQTVYKNRVGWARTYLVKAKLLDYPQRGFFRITDRGLEVIKGSHEEIDNNFLNQFQEFKDFRKRTKKSEYKTAKNDKQESNTPEEVIDLAVGEINSNLEDELLGLLLECSPNYFEQIVVDIIVAMGYGGSDQEAGQVVGKSGDEGIDGIIKEDRLGLDLIYLQAKRWQGVVGRPEIQKFVGALQGKRAKKGIFITTSHFTDNAIEYINNIDNRVILIDGNILTKLMIEYGLGDSTKKTYYVRQIDTDYFTEN